MAGDNQRCPLLGGDNGRPSLALPGVGRATMHSSRGSRCSCSPRSSLSRELSSSCQDPPFPGMEVQQAGVTCWGLSDQFLLPLPELLHLSWPGEVMALHSLSMSGMFCPWGSSWLWKRVQKFHRSVPNRFPKAAWAGSRVCRNGVREMES